MEVRLGLKYYLLIILTISFVFWLKSSCFEGYRLNNSETRRHGVGMGMRWDGMGCDSVSSYGEVRQGRSPSPWLRLPRLPRLPRPPQKGTTGLFNKGPPLRHHVCLHLTDNVVPPHIKQNSLKLYPKPNLFQ